MLEESGRPTPRSSRFTPGEKSRYPSYKRLGGHRGRSGKARKISALPEFEIRIAQPSASRCTHYYIPARYWAVSFATGMLLCGYWRADGSYPTLHRLPAVWCSRKLLLGSVPQSTPLSALGLIIVVQFNANTKHQAVKPTCRRQRGVFESPCAMQIQLT